MFIEFGHVVAGLSERELAVRESERSENSRCGDETTALSLARSAITGKPRATEHVWKRVLQLHTGRTACCPRAPPPPPPRPPPRLATSRPPPSVTLRACESVSKGCMSAALILRAWWRGSRARRLMAAVSRSGKRSGRSSGVVLSVPREQRAEHWCRRVKGCRLPRGGASEGAGEASPVGWRRKRGESERGRREVESATVVRPRFLFGAIRADRNLQRVDAPPLARADHLALDLISHLAHHVLDLPAYRDSLQGSQGAPLSLSSPSQAPSARDGA